MPDSIRQILVDAVLARLRAIKLGPTYQTSIGANIFEWRDLEAEPWLDVEPDVLVVRDREEPAVDGSIQPHTHDKGLAFELEFRTAGGPAGSGVPAPRYGRNIIADIEKALGQDKFWSGKARGTSPLSVSIFDVKKAGRVYAGARLKFSIKYRNKAFDPFNQ